RPRRHHEALRREVDDVVGPRLLEEGAHREEIAQIGLEQADPVAQVLDVLRLAPPAERADHLGALGERILGEVTADEARDARDEDAHPDHTTTGGRARLASGGARGRHARYQAGRGPMTSSASATIQAASS